MKLHLELTDLWFSSAEAVNVIISLKKLTTRLGKQNVACRTPPGSAYRGSSIFVVKPATFATYLSMEEPAITGKYKSFFPKYMSRNSSVFCF